MPKLEIKLKQHTPLIHFQHDQKGATLRASEVKPKLDKYILDMLTPAEKEQGKRDGWIKSKNDKVWLDYKMRIEDNPDNLILLNTNEKKRCYTKRDEENDKKRNRTIRRVKYGDIIRDNNTRNVRFVIVGQDNKEFFAKLRKSDSKIIYDLDSYPCFFANMDSDINNPNEYRKVTFAKDTFDLVILTKYNSLYDLFNDKEKMIISHFFLTHNFGTRQSKGFGSFYLDEEDRLYIAPESSYQFSLPINEECFYDEFYNLFKAIELFSKTLRAGINEKRGKQTVFYFKSLAFMYCKDVLYAEWDKKRVKSRFYFEYSDRKDSLEKQRNEYPNDSNHDILFFDAADGYDIRDLMGFSTNEEWQSYKDSIEKKVAIKRGERLDFPRKDETLPVDRMRSPLLIKPICRVDDEDNVKYTIHLIFQDEKVGMSELKRQEEICFFSKREKDENGRLKRFRLKIPQNFSMGDYFDYIFNTLRFDISSHVEEKYQHHEFYELLNEIYSQLKECKS